MYYSTTYSSPIGCITLACDDKGENLAGAWIQGQKYHGDTIFENMIPNDNLCLFKITKKWLDRYFAGENPCIAELSLAPVGSEFRQNVWSILREIPYGKVTTYGAIAKMLAEKTGKQSMSSQAVGGAVGHNPISIIIPCHRVVGSKGNLTGFASGIPTKLQLLALEGTDLSKMFVPKKGTAL